MISRSNWRIIKRLLGYQKKSVLVRFLSLSMAGFVIAAVGRIGLANMPLVLEFGWNNPETIWVILVSAFIVVAVALQGIGHILGSFSLSLVARQIIKKIRTQLLKSLLLKRQRFFDKQSSESLSSILIYHVEQIYSCLANGIISLIRESLAVLFLLANLLYLNSWFTMILILIVPAAALIIRYISKRFYILSNRIQTSIEQIGQYSIEMFRAIQLIRLYSSVRYQARQFGNVNDSNYKQNIKFVLTQLSSALILEMIVALFIAFLVFLALAQTVGQQFTSLGTFISYIMTVALVGQPIKKLSLVMGTIQKGVAASERTFSYIDEPGENPESGMEVRAKTMRGELVVDNVGMVYPGDVKALDGVSFRVDPGQVIALVGRSGSGKTTLSKLLLRFYEATSGAITLDGQDIRTLSLISLRQQFSLVGQDQVFFNDTIAHNIAYAEESVCMERLKKAADMAHVTEFVNTLDQGFETVVGSNGSLLSGGQKQRIAIARALYRDAPILLLDEATSALDNESDTLVQSALKRLTASKTIIIIAHRLSNIIHADNILVLDKGKVVQQGTHSQLIATAGLYQMLYQQERPEANDNPS